MGANNSKDSSRSGSSIQSINFKNKPQDLVDFGTIFPNGLYTTTPQDFDTRALRQLIVNRKLAPFYKGLNDAPEPVTISSLVSSPSLQPSSSLSTISTPPSANKNIGRPRSASNRSEKMQKNNNNDKEPSHSERMKHCEAMLYNSAVECPICFLYYPPNINYSRCCDQPICTECFIQIHRPTDDPTNPATCPFCLESNYGITYRPPPWSNIQKQPQKRLRSFSSSSSLSSSNISLPPNNHHHDVSTGARHTTSGVSDERKPRRKSVSHTHPDVVLIDHIRPHWNKPAVSSTRSSRRNSLTNTSSSPRNLLRVVTRPGRSASSAASTEYNQYLANVRDMNMDLEEWMVMEAIRLSLQEHDDQQHNPSTQQGNENTNNVTLSPSIITSDSSSNSSDSSVNDNNNNNNNNNTNNDHINNNNNNEDSDDDEQPLALRIPNYQQNEAYITQQQGHQQGQQQNQQDSKNQCKSSSSSIKESSEAQQNNLNKKSSGHDPQTSNDIII